MFFPTDDYSFFHKKASKLTIEGNVNDIISLIQKAVTEKSSELFLKLAEVIFENVLLPANNLFHIFDSPDSQTSTKLEKTLSEFSVRYIENMSTRPSSDFFFKLEIFLLKLKVLGQASVTAKFVFCKSQVLICHYFAFDFQKISQQIPEIKDAVKNFKVDNFPKNYGIDFPSNLDYASAVISFPNTTEYELDLSVDQNYLKFKNTLTHFSKNSSLIKPENAPPILKLLKHNSKNQCHLKSP